MEIDETLPRSRLAAAILPIAAIFYGGWAAAGLLLPDDYYDAPAERIAIGAIGLVVAVVLERRDAPARVHHLASAVFAYVVYAHFLTLFVRSGPSETYALGLLILFAGASLLFHSLLAYLAFGVQAVALLFATAVVVTIPHARFVMLILGVFTVMAVTSILMFLRIQLLEAYHEQRLHNARLERQTLEQQLELAGEQIVRYRVEAQNDPLTGLPNRRLFLDQLDRSCALAQRRGEPIGVLFADLDGFKAINDTYGHEVGDQVLVLFAHHLTQSLRRSDFPARLAGDEFVAILPGLRTLDDAEPVCDRILAIGRAPLHLPGSVTTSISVSIGVVLHVAGPADDRRTISPKQLPLQADKAMYAAKDQGRNRWVGYAAPTVRTDSDR